MRPVTIIPLLSLLLTTGCTMPRPWKFEQYAETCSTVQTAPAQGSQLFITLRQPRCDSGKVMLTQYRSAIVRYASLDNGQISFHEEPDWLREIQRRAQGRPPPVLFIHGYNNSNQEALDRAAAIGGALQGNEVVAFTWPSYAKKSGYFWDEVNSEWAAIEARGAISRFVGSVPTLFVIAHSMGNRIALDAIAHLDSGQARRINRLVMAAADVDRGALVDVLKRRRIETPVTMYVSLRDQALSSSWRGHGYPRAGDSSWWVSGRDRVFPFAWQPNVEVVDTTDVDRSTLGHAAFVDTAPGRSDLCRVIRGTPAQRARTPLLQPAQRSNYFALTPERLNDDCDR